MSSNDLSLLPEVLLPGSLERGVYLAGPSGFNAGGMLWHTQVLIPKVLEAGLLPVDPWADQSLLHDVLTDMDWGVERREALKVANLQLGRLDFARIEASAAVLACLDGQDVDSGTALEIGYAHARGKLIVGVRTDIRLCGDNEGSMVNLMIETAAVDSGGIITNDLDECIALLKDKLLF